MANPEQTAIAQVEFVRKPRFRHFWMPQIGHPKDFASRIISRVVGYINETTANMGFIPANKLTTVHPSDLPHLPMQGANQVDLAFQQPSLDTARKQHTTSSGVDMDQIYRQRGGRPDHRSLKKGGFLFRSSPLEMINERAKKIAEARRSKLYQAHP